MFDVPVQVVRITNWSNFRTTPQPFESAQAGTLLGRGVNGWEVWRQEGQYDATAYYLGHDLAAVNTAS